MFRDVITPGMDRSDWDRQRPEIERRIHSTMGEFPELSFHPTYELIGERTYEDLTLHEIRFSPLAGYETYGTLVLPPKLTPDQKRPAVLSIHGTDVQLAHRNTISPAEKPHRQYGIELAKRGMVTLAVDQFAYGQGNGPHSREQAIEAFYQRFPNWSLDGIRLWIHQCATDILTSLPYVDASSLGCIGHSLGGRAAAYLAAFEPRMTASVVSAGISPNITNVFRNPANGRGLSPRHDQHVAKTGLPLFEYQELLALIAPRSVLLIEPWNDPYNPMIEPIFRCFEKARFVFSMCDAAKGLQILSHGDGHDTQPNIRRYAYDWLAEQMKTGTVNVRGCGSKMTHL